MNIKYDGNFLITNSLRWEVIDEYGWTIKSEDDKLFFIAENRNSYSEIILDNLSIEHLYKLSLRRKVKDIGSFDIHIINLDLKKKKLSLYPFSEGGVRVSLKCEDFERAEELIYMLMEGNDLELAPISKTRE